MVIGDIIKPVEAHPTRLFSFTPKKANMVVQCLAKLGLSLDFDMFWMEKVPPCVVPVVVGDCTKHL